MQPATRSAECQDVKTSAQHKDHCKKRERVKAATRLDLQVREPRGGPERSRDDGGANQREREEREALERTEPA